MGSAETGSPSTESKLEPKTGTDGLIQTENLKLKTRANPGIIFFIADYGNKHVNKNNSF